jgi:hypothetical protein
VAVEPHLFLWVGEDAFDHQAGGATATLIAASGTKQNIRGRSKMGKSDLIKAIRKAR